MVTPSLPSRYRLLDQIGCGGMSVVYRALDNSTGEQVAIKIPHPFLASRADFAKRLQREAKTISSLNHPNILRILDFSSEPQLFLVTEFIEGLTLKAFGEKYRIWSVPEIGALIVRQTAFALAFAHRHGVVHRDIKPENLMISVQGDVKLMDFSIARFDDQESLTMTGSLMGSPAHMAPEIIEGKRGDTRSDIFSLSTVFYWLVSGQLPYKGDNPHTLLKNIVEGRFTPLEELSSQLLPSLHKVIETGMARDPGLRFQSAEEFAERISLALKDVNAEIEDNDLKTLLAEPDSRLHVFAKAVVDQALKAARQKFKEGETLLGAALLNRVVADDPSNVEALSLLESGLHAQSKPSRKLKVLFGVPAAIATGVAAIWLLDHRSDIPDEVLADSVVADAVVADAVVADAVVPQRPVELPTASAKAPKNLTRQVLITVSPYADIWIDGKQMARDGTRLVVPLKIGRHHVVFRHELAATQERVFEVKLQTDNTLHVDLTKTKPAQLVIRTNVDADIAIDGVFKGSTRQTLQRPILIAFPDKMSSRKIEIVLSYNGYMPHIAHYTAIPGKKHNIDVILEPDPS